MKTRYLFFVILLLAGVIVASCDKKSEDSTTTPPLSTQTTPYQAGQVVTYAFLAGGDTMVKMTDEVKDFGVAGLPVLMLVHKETLIQQPGWGSVFFPVFREQLDSVLPMWSIERNLNFTTLNEKAMAARDFLDFIVRNNIDPGLFIRILLGSYSYRIPSVIDVIAAAESRGKDPNDYIYRMWYEKIPPETVLNEFKPDQYVFIASIFLSIGIQFSTWYTFATKTGSVDNPPNYFASFLCSDDTDLSHYSGGTTFQSRDYHLSYDAGVLEAKCTYHVAGEYNDVNPNCPGKWIKKCNVTSTYVHVKGALFIVDAAASYSPAINVGTFEVPVPEMNDKVKVTYGDCCCFRKYSYLNYKISGETGYKEMTFDPGK